MNWSLEDIEVLFSGTDTKGKFIIEPLEGGYGITLGNSIRRILLSSIQGTAPVGIKINKSLHEFSTIEGVEEDIEEIILNTKKLVSCIVEGNEAQLHLYKEGPGEVRAKDFDENPLIKISNQDLYIANITSPSSYLDITLYLKKGKGYITLEENQEIEKGVDYIVMDSFFSPIKNVNFIVEPVRVGQSMDFDRLILDIESTPNVKVQDALVQALEILIKYSKTLFMKVRKEELILPDIELSSGRSVSDEEKWANYSIDDLVKDGLNERALNALKKAEMKTVKDVLEKFSKKGKIKSFGKASHENLKDVLRKLGLELPDFEE